MDFCEPQRPVILGIGEADVRDRTIAGNIGAIERNIQAVVSEADPRWLYRGQEPS